MAPRLSLEAPARNPVARSLALAVLAVALVAAALMGIVVFGVLLAVFIVGYLVTFVHAQWRGFRIRRRVAAIFEPTEQAASAGVIEAELEPAEATADAARRVTGGPQ